MKLLIVAMTLFATTAFADGMPDHVFGSTTFPEEIKTPRLSSYQVLKIKYDNEAAYSEELKDRIDVLYDEIEVKDSELKACSEKKDDNNWLLSGIIGFIIGVIIE